MTDVSDFNCAEIILTKTMKSYHIFHPGDDSDPEDEESILRFEKLSDDERRQWLHGTQMDALRRIWEVRIDDCLALNLDLIRLDFRHCRCPWGCCRLGSTICEYLSEEATNISCPKRIEIVGALDIDRDEIRQSFGHGNIP